MQAIYIILISIESQIFKVIVCTVTTTAAATTTATTTTTNNNNKNNNSRNSYSHILVSRLCKIVMAHIPLVKRMCLYKLWSRKNNECEPNNEVLRISTYYSVIRDKCVCASVNVKETS